MTFEENLQQLQQLTEKLEKESLPLEEAIAVYQQGMQLSEVCRNALQDAEEQFSLITEEVQQG